MLTGAQDGKTILDVASNPDVITMGINSSHAHLHTGHYLTMYQALLALHRNPQAKGKFFVDDREFDMKKNSR